MKDIIICSSKKNIINIKQEISVLDYYIVTSQSSALNLIKALLKKENINSIIYDESIDIDKKIFKKYVGNNIVSFTEIKNCTKTDKTTTRHKDHINKDVLITKSNKKDKTKENRPKEDKSKENHLLSNKLKYITPKETYKTKNLPTLKQKASRSNVFAFTSVKGGVGVSSTICNISKLFSKVLILDLAFIPGGSDLSYYFNLPQVPHLTTYAKDESGTLFDNCIPIDGNFIMQSPPTINLYNSITENIIVRIINDFNGIILIDIPLNNKFANYIFNIAEKIFVINQGTPMEVNRIQKCFQDNFDNKLHSIVTNASSRDYKAYFKECNLVSVEEKIFIKTISEYIYTY